MRPMYNLNYSVTGNSVSIAPTDFCRRLIFLIMLECIFTYFYIPVTFEDPALLTAHRHPNHLPYVSSSGLRYLSPRSISKSFGYTMQGSRYVYSINS